MSSVILTRLSVRLALWMVLATACLQGGNILYRIAVDIPNAKSQKIEEINKLVVSLEPAFKESLFQYNDDLTEQLLKSFIEYPSVQSVQVLDDAHGLMNHWQRLESTSVEVEELIIKALVYEDQLIGYLKLTLDLSFIIDHAEKKIKDQIWFSAFMGGVSLLILYLVAQYQVTLPIIRLAHEVASLNTLALSANDVKKIEDVSVNAEMDALRHSLKKILIELTENIEENHRSHTLLKEFSIKLESKVIQRTEELEESKEVAERANQSKTDFMNTMTHELRTPLNSILGFSSILKGQDLPDKLMGIVESVHGSGMQLLQLVNDIMDYVDLETKPLTVQAFSIFDVLNSVYAESKVLAVNRSLKLNLQVDHTLVSKGDPKRLSMVIRHLVGNAIKFTEKGRVDIAAYERDGCLVITISDTGPGIDLSRIDNLSEAFVQMDQSIARSNEGVGLGLAIVDRILRKWGANIVFTHAEPHGTIVEIVLPDIEEAA